MMDHELQDWIEKSLNETATKEESRALEERLLSDAQARDHYLNEVNLHACLRRRFSASAESPSITPFSVDPWQKFAIGMAIAASLALVAGIVTILAPPSQATAVVAHAVGAYLDDGRAYVVGDAVEPGSFEVTRGLMRLDFSNGAKVTVEGPAEFEVIDDMRMILHRGVVTATIPESAIGFVVDTDSAQVVDLGTSFGVSVNEDRLTDVCVFEGEVEVSLAGRNATESVPRLVKEGEAIRTVKGSGSIDIVSYETSRFENAWPLNADVLQTTGSIRFVSPGPNFHPGNYKDNEHIVVFPEKREYRLEKEIKVDLADPGQYAKTGYESKPKLQPGRRLSSYLLQLNAYPEGKNPQRRRGVRGQITFAKPIAGVITLHRLLSESEVLFGYPEVDYPKSRTIEPRPSGDKRKGFDSLILAADRRTLIVEMQENPGNLDQIRVLVEAD